MYPAADDNYGLDACSLLCLPSRPPVIAMATASGKIYHCITLESEETFDPEEVRWFTDCHKRNLNFSKPMWLCQTQTLL